MTYIGQPTPVINSPNGIGGIPVQIIWLLLGGIIFITCSVFVIALIPTYLPNHGVEVTRNILANNIYSLNYVAKSRSGKTGVVTRANRQARSGTSNTDPTTCCNNLHAKYGASYSCSGCYPNGQSNNNPGKRKRRHNPYLSMNVPLTDGSNIPFLGPVNSITAPNQAPTCFDGVQNQGETSTDCGGPCTGKKSCGIGSSCQNNDDCKSILCIRNICRQPTCFDGIQNQGETSTDCGGPCSGQNSCGVGNSCQTNTDCKSNFCSGNTCQGGSSNPSGASCANNGDCQSGICTNNICKKPTCFDGVQNQDETSPDCGGTCTEKHTCDDEDPCQTNADCESNFCNDNICEGTNDDANGAFCSSDGDCVSGICTNNICEASGSDNDGAACDNDDDCESKLCTDSICQAATCFDGVENQGETSTDCGGPCTGQSSCADGDSCDTDDDCESGTCTDDICADSGNNADGIACDTGDDCVSGTCTDNICEASDNDADGAPCSSNEDCKSGICTEDICAASSGNDDGTACDTDDDCVSGTCTANICEASDSDADGAACSTNEDCESGICTEDICAASSGNDDGTACDTDDDCESKNCTGSICQVATCFDDIQNQGETSTDCGGPCTGQSSCADGDSCDNADDCESGVCAGSICQVATCFDGVQNQGETSTDCGGPCTGQSSCAAGDPCQNNLDCQSGNCTSNIC